MISWQKCFCEELCALLFWLLVWSFIFCLLAGIIIRTFPSSVLESKNQRDPHEKRVNRGFRVTYTKKALAGGTMNGDTTIWSIIVRTNIILCENMYYLGLFFTWFRFIVIILYDTSNEFDLLSASFALNLQINWLVFIWGQHWHLIG